MLESFLKTKFVLLNNTKRRQNIFIFFTSEPVHTMTITS